MTPSTPQSFSAIVGPGQTLNVAINGTYGRYFQGYLADVRIYNTNIGATVINKIANFQA